MDNDLALLIRYFESAEQASQDGRRDSEQARDYYDGKQLTDTEIATLRKRKQPPVVINRIQRKIDYLRGLERQSRTDPKAWPRTQADEQDADSATDALRYVAADQLIDIKRSQVFENMLIEGFGGCEVTVTRGPKGVIDPKVSHIAWDRIFYDPHSSAHDFADAGFLGYVTWMDADKAKQRWPEKAEIIEATQTKPTSSSSETYDDKPRWTYWFDAERKRIRIVTMYYQRDEAWFRCEFTLAGHLTDPAESPWVDEDGKPECGLILQSAYVDRDNDRYGIVRSMISPQDEINKRRSKALHMLNMRQVRVSPGVQASAETIRKELAKPDGIIEADRDEVEILPNGDLVAGHFQLLQEAKSEIDLMGPNATMQGKASQDSSGRAILALQQGGMTEMAPLLDNLRHFTIRLYRQVWNRIRQYWTAERWLRITDDERNIRFAVVNPTYQTLAKQKVGKALEAGQIDQPTHDAYAAEIDQRAAMDPRSQQIAQPIAELDVDIDISEVDEAPTVAAEQFEMLAKMVAAGLPIPPDVMIEAAPGLRNKDKLLKMLEDQRSAQSAPNPMQELQMRGAEAEVAKTEGEAMLNHAKAKNEALKPQLEAMQALAAMHQAPPDQHAA